MTQELPSWNTAVLAGLISAFGAVLGWFRFRRERADSRGDRETELRDRMRTSMDTQSLAMWDRLEAENKRLAVRLAEMEHDRNRGWDLARWWNSEAHRVKHLQANLLQIAISRTERLGMLLNEINAQPFPATERQISEVKRLCTTIEVPQFSFPDLEDPIPRRQLQQSRGGGGMD